MSCTAASGVCARNSPLVFIDNRGRDILYAPGLRNSVEVKSIVEAILANPDTSAELCGYVGPENPDLTITSGDLSAGDTVVRNQDGTVTTTTVSGNFGPDIQTTKANNDPPETHLYGGTLTIDNRASGDALPGIVVHESKHAGDAKRDPAGFSQDSKRERNLPHDQRPQEKAANQFSAQHKKQISKEAKELRKRQEQDAKERKKQKETEQ